MISIDTNVLLRYLLQDDETQSVKATKLILNSDTVLVTDVVLAETLWTLKGKKYKLSKDDLLLVIHELFKEPSVLFEDGQSVWRAYNHLRNSKKVKVGSKTKDVDFADALILEKSKYEASARSDDFVAFYTFDVAAQQLPDTKKV